jgi:exonuclease III
MLAIASQNVRGLTEEKIETIRHNSNAGHFDVFCVQETWSQGSSITDYGKDGTLISCGEAQKSCKRGRSGAAIFLNDRAKNAWIAGGRIIKSDSKDGRVLSIELATSSNGSLSITSAYAPTSGEKSSLRSAFLENVMTCAGNSSQNRITIICIDANASLGTSKTHSYQRFMNCKHTGEKSLLRFKDPLGPNGIPRTNQAGHEIRSFLLEQKLCSTTTFFKSRKHNCGTWFHPRFNTLHQIDHILCSRSHLGRVKNASCPHIARQ